MLPSTLKEASRNLTASVNRVLRAADGPAVAILERQPVQNQSLVLREIAHGYANDGSLTMKDNLTARISF